MKVVTHDTLSPEELVDYCCGGCRKRGTARCGVTKVPQEMLEAADTVRPEVLLRHRRCRRLWRYLLTGTYFGRGTESVTRFVAETMRAVLGAG